MNTSHLLLEFTCSPAEPPPASTLRSHTGGQITIKQRLFSPLWTSAGWQLSELWLQAGYWSKLTPAAALQEISNCRCCTTLPPKRQRQELQEALKAWRSTSCCLTVMRTENCTSASRFDHVYVPNCCHVIGWLYICVREQLDSCFCKVTGQCKFSQSDTSGEVRLLCVASPHTPVFI